MKRMRDELTDDFIFSTHDQKIVGEAEIIYSLERWRTGWKHAKGGKEMRNLLKSL